MQILRLFCIKVNMFYAEKLDFSQQMVLGTIRNI